MEESTTRGYEDAAFSDVNIRAFDFALFSSQTAIIIILHKLPSINFSQGKYIVSVLLLTTSITHDIDVHYK